MPVKSHYLKDVSELKGSVGSKKMKKECAENIDRIAIDRALEMIHSHDCEKHNDKLACESMNRASDRARKLTKEIQKKC